MKDNDEDNPNHNTLYTGENHLTIVISYLLTHLHQFIRLTEAQMIFFNGGSTSTMAATSSQLNHPSTEKPTTNAILGFGQGFMVT